MSSAADTTRSRRLKPKRNFNPVLFTTGMSKSDKSACWTLVAAISFGLMAVGGSVYCSRGTDSDVRHHNEQASRMRAIKSQERRAQWLRVHDTCLGLGKKSRQNCVLTADEALGLHLGR